LENNPTQREERKKRKSPIQNLAMLQIRDPNPIFSNSNQFADTSRTLKINK
jgi:hypothetical protein